MGDSPHKKVIMNPANPPKMISGFNRLKLIAPNDN